MELSTQFWSKHDLVELLMDIWREFVDQLCFQRILRVGQGIRRAQDVTQLGESTLWEGS